MNITAVIIAAVISTRRITGRCPASAAAVVSGSIICLIKVYNIRIICHKLVSEVYLALYIAVSLVYGELALQLGCPVPDAVFVSNI